MTQGTRTTTTRPRRNCASAPAVTREPVEGALDLLLGWKAKDTPRAAFGFSGAEPVAAVESAPGEEPIFYGEDRHLLTIAPTGAGKGRGVIIPNLLRFEFTDSTPVRIALPTRIARPRSRVHSDPERP